MMLRLFWFTTLLALFNVPVTWAQWPRATPLLTGIASEFQPEVPWSGRINGIARHPEAPNIVIVASDSGGLFRSTDGGTTWSHVDSFLPFFLSDVMFHPDDPTLVIATARRDYRKFSILPAWLEHRALFSDSPFRAREIQELSGRVAEIAGSNVAQPRLFETILSALTIETSGGGIWISRDRGLTWYRPPTAVPLVNGTFSSAKVCPPRYSAYAISVEPGTGKVFVGTDCGVSVSSNRGVSWTHQQVSGLPNGAPVFAIAAMGDDRVLAGSKTRMFWTVDGGENWSRDNGAPGGVGSKEVHAIGDLPVSKFALAVVDKTLYRVHFGSSGPSWLPIPTPPTAANNCGGIKIARGYYGNPGSNVLPTGIYLFFGDKCHPFVARATERAGGIIFPNSASDWTKLPQSHWDTRDLLPRLALPHAVAMGGTGIPTVGGHLEPVVDDGGLIENNTDPDFATVVDMVANDGGLDIYDSSNTPVPVGSGPGKINALQLYDVEGQQVGSSRHDLYFGTQDNRIIASTDFGQTWPHRTNGGEGFGLNAAKSVSSANQSLITFLWGGSFRTKMSDAGLANIRDWPDPYDETIKRSGYPLILSGATRVQIGFTEPATEGDAPTDFHLFRTSNRGQDWTTVADINAPIRSGIQIGAPAANNGPHVFVGYKAANQTLPYYLGNFSTPVNALAVIRGSLSGSNIQAEYPAMNGMGAMSVVPTNFNWYLPYGTDSANPNRLLAADVKNDVMVESIDLGENWQTNAAMTDAVTRNGAFYFVSPNHVSKRYFPLVSAISFHPENANLVIIGTRQSGVHVSGDGGITWSQVYESERISSVTDIHWVSEDIAMVSSYGRGLWRIDLAYAPGLIPKFPPDENDPDPIIDICGQTNCRADSIDDLMSDSGERFTPELLGSGKFDGGFLVYGGSIERHADGSELSVSGGATVAQVTRPWVAAEAVLTKLNERLGPKAMARRGRPWIGVLTRGGEPSAVITADATLPGLPKAESDYRPAAPMSLKSLVHDMPYVTLWTPDMIHGFPVVDGDESDLVVVLHNFAPGELYQLLVDGEAHGKPIRLSKGSGNQYQWPVTVRALDMGEHRVSVVRDGAVVDEVALFVVHRDEANEE